MIDGFSTNFQEAEAMGRIGMHVPTLVHFLSSPQLDSKCTQSSTTAFAASDSCRCSRRVPDFCPGRVAVDGQHHLNATASIQLVSRDGASERKIESDRMAGRELAGGGGPWRKVHTAP